MSYYQYGALTETNFTLCITEGDVDVEYLISCCEEGNQAEGWECLPPPYYLRTSKHVFTHWGFPRHRHHHLFLSNRLFAVT